MKQLKLLLGLIVYSFTIQAQPLSRQVFELGNNKEDCQVSAECDCCTSDLFFLGDKQFAMLNYCTFSNDLMTGTYKTESNNLVLTFTQTVVTSGQTEKEGKDFITKKSIVAKPLQFTIGRCEDGKMMLERSDATTTKTFGL
ncbi:MAG: hypothetical protein WDN75_08115 [Bacteroidota bacterium]